MPRPAQPITKPCEYCGTPITKTGKERSQRKYWTCDASCANKLRIKLGNTPTWAPNPLRGQQETRPCAVCGVPVTRYLSQARALQQWTCSRRCAATLRARTQMAAGTWVRPQKPRTGDIIPCATCGTEFYRQPAYIKQNRRYCSEACANIGKTKTPVVKACARCGAEMRLRPSYGHMQYCSKRCEADAKIKRRTGRVHNGRPVLLNFQGYLTIYEPTHPAAGKNGRVLEHRWVVEQLLGRFLTTDEQVDHINRDKTDNQPQNLQVLSAHDHSVKTNADKLSALAALRDELEEYRRRFGPLSPS